MVSQGGTSARLHVGEGARLYKCELQGRGKDEASEDGGQEGRGSYGSCQKEGRNWQFPLGP